MRRSTVAPSRPVRLARAAALACALGALFVQLGAAVANAQNVTTAGYNTLRDNWDPSEPSLGPATLTSGHFGELFSTSVEGEVYSQPLVYGGDVIVTTEKADAYAINATTGAIVWKRSFGSPFTSSAIHCSDLTPDLGSTSTPVIDPSTGTIYITTRLFTGPKRRLKDSAWYLQAVSAETGEERPGFPVRISGTPYNSTDPAIPFNENYQQQRPGLLLLNGVVYMAFASDCDIAPYRGIVVGVNDTSGAITTMWTDESGGGDNENSRAGIWQSGGGLVSYEPGNILLTSGNGISPSPAPSDEPPPTLSESVVGFKVEPSGEIVPDQFFAPSNAPEMDNNDEDLGSGGPLALPSEYFGTKKIPQLIVQVGKDGRIFLLNAHDLGGYRQGAGGGNAVLQTLGPYRGVWGHLAAYGGQGGWVYEVENAGGGFLRALSYGLDGEGEPRLASQATSAETFGYTSGSPLLTSNGTTAGSPVVWVVHLKGENGLSLADAQLRAYDGTPEGSSLKLLWTGKIGKAVKFATPTASEGRVYVGTNGHLIAFGATGASPLQARPVDLGAVRVGSSVTRTVTVSASKSVKLAAPIASEGEQGTARPVTPLARTHVINRLTAGPTKIPPSGLEPLGRGVITVRQPRRGTAISAAAPLRVRISFKPVHAGPVVAILTIRTTAGVRSVTVTGYGTRPGLATSPQPLSFGLVRTGIGKSLALTVINSWRRPERITRVRLPRGPFRVEGLPKVGFVLAPRQAVTADIHFAPRRRGRYVSSITVKTNHGGVTLPVSGLAAVGRPRLRISATLINFGQVPVGSSRTRTFTLADAGNIPTTITRAIAPEEPFAAVVPLAEGITIEPEVDDSVSVRFHPTSDGPARGEYIIQANDGRGRRRVVLIGTGT